MEARKEEAKEPKVTTRQGSKSPVNNIPSNERSELDEEWGSGGQSPRIL